MVSFSKLKLYGFKSFVDKTELEIGAGLNGIVGPNGCGKSNLVEALRWVMGEKSAKNMRGSGMEDVIFAGTSKRPARNMAEVTVVMTNEDGTAPAPFENSSEIEINRKIEKDKGSQYRVNGKAVRARDVNLLFADTMTGATSPALVSQGRITEIITAKPSDRRKILEDSAGISGLHTRRHEAELRLRAAEQNLTRLDDVLAEMRTRLSSLKRQARQAERYKEFSTAIRKFDMALAWMEWRETHGKIKAEREHFATHNDTVQQALEATKSLSTEIESLETALPALRKFDMESRAVLQNFRVALDRLEQDIQSKTKGLQDAEQSKAQLLSDIDYTRDQLNRVLNDYDRALRDRDALVIKTETLPTDIDMADAYYKTLKSNHDDLTAQKQTLGTAMAVAHQSRNTSIQREADITSAIEKIAHNISNLQSEIQNNEAQITQLKQNDAFENSSEKFSKNITSLEAKITDLSTTIVTKKSTFEGLKAERDTLISDARGMESERTALQSMIDRARNNDFAPHGDDALMNALKVHSGYEKAVSSALGQWLAMAGLNANASVYWVENTIRLDAPNGTDALVNYVDAPDVLTPLLSAIGVADNLDADLNVGQIVVTRDGAFKRWDGLIVTADVATATDQTGMILEQKNRVEILGNAITDTQSKLDLAIEKLDIICPKITELESDLRDTQSQLQTTQNQKRDFDTALERITNQIALYEDKLTDQRVRLVQNEGEHKELQTQLVAIQSTLDASDDTALISQKAEIETLTVTISTLSVDLETAQQNAIGLKQSHQTLSNQIATLDAQMDRLSSEKANLEARQDDYGTRLDAVEAKITGYKHAQGDDEIDAMREGLLTKISNQETQLREISITLETQEKSYRDRQSHLRDAESNAASARELRALSQANVANAEEDLTRITSDITDKFEMNPQSLEEQVHSLFDTQIPDHDALLTEKETVTRQRDSIGPVNLRAAIESAETESQLAEMEVEYTDLTKAIAQLRGGIAKLNAEAKERLAIAFTRVDNHFQKLFAQLFEGGRAYLQMIESDDPLESGLEIYAEPPGKALQKLSLLSGGEQTLTAIALIFGMFLTNPSPICVLDEIDAPLDDANVDRVCSLMEIIARDTETRFIVITHHRMTMARMDRLYGVTMGERGVSQLVSVDLALQAEMDLAETG